MSEDIRNKLKAGMIVRVHQKIKETNPKGEEKERIQIFEGTVLAVRHGNEAGATVTVRKVSNGVGVEKIFPIHSPVVEKIELLREMAVAQGKAFYLRTYKKKLKEIKKKIVGEKEEIVKEKVENPVLEVVENNTENTEVGDESIPTQGRDRQEVSDVVEEKIEEKK